MKTVWVSMSLDIAIELLYYMVDLSTFSTCLGVALMLLVVKGLSMHKRKLPDLQKSVISFTH